MNGRWADAFERVPGLLAAHVELCLAAILLALALSVPLSIMAARSKRVAGGVLTAASIIQTIPALALLALFFPLLLALRSLLGDWISPLGFLPALLALTLYALLPIIRNAVTGLTGVEPAMIEAADGIGMNARQKLLLVEAPLAAPTIMAGIRTAAVWTIGIATLSTTIGQSSLGDLIFAGLQTQNWALVLAGCIASAGLALAADALLGLIQRGIVERRRWKVWLALALIAAGLFTALAPRLFAAPDRDVVTVGAKGFSEQFILARMIGERLEAAGYDVRYREGLGSAVVFQALSSGDIDVYVDYAGTIWTNEMERDAPIERDAMRAAIAEWTMKTHKVRLVGALGFENAYAFAVRKDDARERGLASLDDLARVSPDLALGADLEFLERPEWAQVKAAYPMRFRAERTYDPTFMYRALQSGQVDAISAFSSDGRIAAFDFVTLTDPKGAIPNYDAIMMVAPGRADDGKFLAAIEPLVGAIGVDDMRKANYMVDRDDDKRSPRAAARWLSQQTGVEK